MSKTLVMNFLNAEGKKASIRVSGIKDTLAAKDVSDVMDNIISKNIFSVNGLDLKNKNSAQITERNTEELEVK
mgnify:CR=1 FL=1